MKLEHKYIRLATSEELYQEMLDNRELEEAAVVAVTDDRVELPDRYKFSVRTTNNDDKVEGSYNAIDPIHTFGGLELIWGYFGWAWSDITFNGNTLKGGNFIKLKDTKNYPRIYDGYRLQHINNLCDIFPTLAATSNIVTVGYFDNSEIVSADYAFRRTVARIDQGDNVWPKLESAVDMFSNADNFSNWDPEVELYFPVLKVCNNLFNAYSSGCPKVNFNGIETINTFASSLGDNDDTSFYFGDYEDSAAKGLEECYDFGVFNIKGSRVESNYYFKPLYKGEKLFLLPQISYTYKTNYTSVVTTATIECDIPWSIKSSIENKSSSSNFHLDFSNLNFNKIIPPEGDVYLLKGIYVSQDTEDPNYIPGLPCDKIRSFLLFDSCIFKGNFVFDADNEDIDLDYGIFKEFGGRCSVPEGSTLTINNIHLWDTLMFGNMTGGNRKTSESYTNTSYAPYTNIHIPLCPKDSSGRIEETTFSYLSLPYLEHKDEKVTLTPAGSMVLDFKGTYENCIYTIDPSKITTPNKNLDFRFQLADGKTPIIRSDRTINLDYYYKLGDSWSLNNAYTKEIHCGELKIYNSDSSYGYIWLFDKATNLEYIDLPVLTTSTEYRFDRCTKLDPQCLYDHISKITSSKSLVVNRVVWNKLSNEQQELIKSKISTITVYENESAQYISLSDLQ